MSAHLPQLHRKLLAGAIDDGVGFVLPDQPQALTQAGHFGLLGMQERVTQLGGTFHIDTTPGHGTSVEVSLSNQPAPD